MSVLVWHVAYLYLIVAAFFLGKFEAEDYYRGRNGTSRGILQNLLFALFWPITWALASLS